MSSKVKIAPRRSDWLRALRAQIADYFASKGLAVTRKYPYILVGGQDSWPQNIIDSEVVRFIERIRDERLANKKGFPLHKYAHHGLSSQAMLFNLLGPVLIAKRWDAFDSILDSTSTRLPQRVIGAELEFEDRSVFNEQQAQPTSVDLYLHTHSGEPVIAEFKFTEAEFGTCSLFTNGDCDGRNPATDFELCYLHTIGRGYWKIMQRHGLITDTLRGDSTCPFAIFYQAYRLLMFALEHSGYFLLIYDERNSSLVWRLTSPERGAFVRFEELLPPHAQDRCYSISIRRIVEVLDVTFPFATLEEVKAKYL